MKGAWANQNETVANTYLYTRVGFTIV